MRYPLPEPEKDEWLKAGKVSGPVTGAVSPPQTGQPGCALTLPQPPALLQARLWLQQPRPHPKPCAELGKCPRAQPQLLHRARENPREQLERNPVTGSRKY